MSTNTNQNTAKAEEKKIAKISEKRLNELIEFTEKACRMANDFFDHQGLAEWTKQIAHRGLMDMETICCDNNGYDLECVRKLTLESYITTMRQFEMVADLYEIRECSGDYN